MNERLIPHLQEGEQLLWTCTPKMKTMDTTHKLQYIAKVAVIAVAAGAFLAYYMAGVSAGTIEFKTSVMVLLAALIGVALAPDFMDVSKLNKAVYAATDRRLISLVGNNVHTIAYDKIDAYCFDTDQDGQTTLMCGKSGMKSRPGKRRVQTIYGTRLSDDGTVCDRFVLYGITEARKLEALMKKYAK